MGAFYLFISRSSILYAYIVLHKRISPVHRNVFSFNVVPDLKQREREKLSVNHFMQSHERNMIAERMAKYSTAKWIHLRGTTLLSLLHSHSHFRQTKSFVFLHINFYNNDWLTTSCNCNLVRSIEALIQSRAHTHTKTSAWRRPYEAHVNSIETLAVALVRYL